MSILGAIAACVFAITIPSVYYAISIIGSQNTLTAETAFIAKSIEKIVQARPDLWEFESVRLKDLISQPPVHGEEVEREILTVAGNLVTKTDFTETGPIISVSAAFFDLGQRIGTIVVRQSIRKQIITTVILGILSSLFGYLIYFIFRTYPIRKLEDTLADLKQERDKSEKTLYSIGDGVITIDHTGQITFLNRVAESLIGMDASEAVGRQLDEVYVLRQGQEDKVGEEEYILTSNGGNEYIVDEVRTSLPDNESSKSGMLISFRNITDRKKAEEAVQNSEKRYRRLFEAAKDGILILDADTGKVVDVNPFLLQLLGYSYDELCGQHIWELGVFKDIAASKEAFKTLQDNEYIRYEDLPLETKDGKAIDVEFVSNVYLVDHSKVIQCNIRDITKHKLMVEEHQTLEQRLHNAEKMEALGHLAGGVAHDLNNVLGIIVGYSELILDSVDASSPIKPHLVNIMNGGQKAAAIVEDLLTLARRGVSGSSILNLNQTVADCQKSPEFANLASYHPAVKIVTDLESDLPNISGSSVHLGKSLYNLISNASEAMPKGGTITIKTISQYIDKPIQGYDQIREGEYVVLSVSDTGEGISADDLKRIFEPFYTKKIMGRSGTGLGLAVVWGTVKDHNGYIDVQSEEGKGSTFTIYFPVTRDDLTTEAVSVAISEYMGQGESILVVDDVKEQRDLAASLLSKLNYNVSSVSSGEGAVAYLKEHEADLMVLDMIMDPGMDGLDTYRKILEIRPNQKAIIVSGFSESDRVKTAEGLGAGAYVRKPYIKEKLGLAVRKEFDRK